MADMKSEKGVPSPFPAPLQTSQAAQNTVAQNTNAQNTAPQADVAAKTNQPPQTTVAAPAQNAQTAQAPAPAQNIQSTQTAAPVQNVQSTQTAAPVQNAQTAQAPVPSQNVQPANTQAQPNSTPATPFADASTYHYLTGGGFARDMTFYHTYKNRKTGFANMDSIQPFLPGLYGIGAQPGGGKTTFSWQLANQQAYMGQYVLYFALEQTKYELVPKSLSHRFYMEHLANARQNNGQSSLPLYTSTDIRFGNADNAQVQNMATAQAMDTQDRLFVFGGEFSHSIDEICFYIESFICQMGRIPVVIIDYLQITEPVGSQQTQDTKSKIDQVVKRLKQIQLKYVMAIVVISSLNRLNYTMPIELDSFKESGSIEYTFDVVWGLELSLLSDPNFTDHYDKNGKKLGKKTETEKRIMLSQAKQATPRTLEMRYIKNRFGAAGQSVYFYYYPAYETFLPAQAAGIIYGNN